jgi:hypothetical protein
MKKRPIEQRVSELEHAQGINIPVVVSVEADDPDKEAKIAAAQEACGDRDLIVITRTFVSP